MEYPELNEKNVLQILDRGFRKEAGPNTFKVSKIMNQLPDVYFDREILDSEKENLRAMFGQTKIIHDGEELFDFHDGKYLYDGTKWTNSDTNLAYFYYLLSADLLMSPPMYDKNGRPFYEVFEIIPKKTRLEDTEKSIGDD